MNFVPCAFEIQALDDALSMISVGIKLGKLNYISNSSVISAICSYVLALDPS